MLGPHGWKGVGKTSWTGRPCKAIAGQLEVDVAETQALNSCHDSSREKEVSWLKVK